MKMNRLLRDVCLLAFLHASIALSSDTAPADTWTLASSGLGTASVQASGDAVTVSFPAQGDPPSPLICDLLIGGADPSSLFTGDLLTRGYSGIRMKIASNGFKPASVRVVIRQQDGRYLREWGNANIQVSETPGEWTVSLLPLARVPNWTTSFESMKKTAEQMWDADIRAVQSMILRIIPAGTNEQAYSVSDFQLVGPGVISEAANLTPLQAYFGVSSIDKMSPEMFRLDSDGDGMTDYNEILAGMDPRNSTSVFSASVNVGGMQNTVSWSGVLGKRYGVLRSNNLAEGFSLIDTGIECKSTGVMTYTDNSPVQGSANFYKTVSY